MESANYGALHYDRVGRFGQAGVRYLGLAAQVMAVVVLASDVCAVVANAILRYFGHPLDWSDDYSQIALVTLTFVGGAATTSSDSHMQVRIIDRHLHAAQREVLDGVRNGLVAIMMGVTTYGAWVITLSEWSAIDPDLNVPEGTLILPVVIGAALIGLISILRGISRLYSLIGMVGTFVLILVLGRFFYSDISGAIQASTGTILAGVLGLLALLLVMGVPIAFALGWGGLIYFLTQSTVPISVFAQRLDGGLESEVLLAIPFFVLAGGLMGTSGISDRLIGFLTETFGRLRGGLGIVMVISMYLFSGISGSKSADMAGVGTVLVPTLTRNGTPRGRSVALLTACAAMGESIPPSIALLVLAVTVSLSVGALLVAGILPALVVAVLLAGYVAWRKEVPSVRSMERLGVSVVGRSLLYAAPALAMPVGIIVPILIGLATPTEVSGFAVVYGVVLGKALARKDLTLKQILEQMTKAVTLTGAILVALSTATALGYVLVLNEVPQTIAVWVSNSGANSFLYMLITIVVMIAVGQVLEGLPALLVFAPILFPEAIALHISPIQFGIVMIIAMGIGTFLPPIGTGVYIASKIGGSTVGEATVPLLRYIAVVLVGLVITAAWPPITTFLPHILVKGY